MKYKTFLAVQWLTLHAGGTPSIPGERTNKTLQAIHTHTHTQISILALIMPV